MTTPYMRPRGQSQNNGRLNVTNYPQMLPLENISKNHLQAPPIRQAFPHPSPYQVRFHSMQQAMQPSTMLMPQLKQFFDHRSRMPYIEIIEQPASKATRFRYQCEGRPAGKIPGIHSTAEKKTFPTIKVHNCTGKVKIVISCVTENLPYRVHPHKITSKENSRDGVVCVTVDGGEVVNFSDLGIQCVKRKDVVKSIEDREALKVDPFNSGYDHKYNLTEIDLNSIRLAFQGFIVMENKSVITLEPVVSDVIYDKKSMFDLAITKLSHYSGKVNGGLEMILLCEKISKDDIQIRFFETFNGNLKWEGFGVFASSDVHKQSAIIFRTPQYKHLEIKHPVKVFVQLKRPSDGAISNPVEFQFLPISTYDSVDTEIYTVCKRARLDNLNETNNNPLFDRSSAYGASSKSYRNENLGSEYKQQIIEQQFGTSAQYESEQIVQMNIPPQNNPSIQDAQINVGPQNNQHIYNNGQYIFRSEPNLCLYNQNNSAISNQENSQPLNSDHQRINDEQFNQYYQTDNSSQIIQAPVNAYEPGNLERSFDDLDFYLNELSPEFD